MTRPIWASPSKAPGSSAPPGSSPPSRCRGEPAGQASDVFSLGLILYELATGKMAFPAGNLLRILDQIRSVEPESLAAEAPELFTPLLRQLLVADPVQRTITMREAAEYLLGASEPPAGFSAL